MKRILAIDPTIKGFAYAVLDGSDLLAEWGTARLRVCEPGEIRRRVEKLLQEHEPDLLVLEDCWHRDARRSTKAKRFIRTVEALVKKRGLRSRLVSTKKARVSIVGQDDATKYKTAIAITERFPELQHKLPRFRKPWMSEDERMNIFDAVALAFEAARVSSSQTNQESRLTVVSP